jgi:hypothetical protein
VFAAFCCVVYGAGAKKVDVLLRQEAKFFKGNRTAAVEGAIYAAALSSICSKVSKLMSSQTAKI